MPSGTEKNCLELTQLYIYMQAYRFVHLSSSNGILVSIPAHKTLVILPYTKVGTLVVRQLNSISIAQPVHKLCENHQTLHGINKFSFCLLWNHQNSRWLNFNGICGYHSGVDPGIYVSGGALDRRGVWGPPNASASADVFPLIERIVSSLLPLSSPLSLSLFFFFFLGGRAPGAPLPESPPVCLHLYRATPGHKLIKF